MGDHAFFDETELAEAVDIQRRSYRLLRWAADAVTRGVIHITAIHKYATAEESAREWITKHLSNAPPDCRPAVPDGPPIDRFARFFTSYLLTSFDLDPEPGNVTKSACGCFCPVCRYLSAGSHLVTKKLTPRHKRRAEKLKEDFVAELIAECRTTHMPGKVEQLLADETYSAAAALGAYGAELLRRCKGLSEGPAVLALWRQFAWKKSGSPKKNFELRASDIIQAERTISEHLFLSSE